MHEARAGGPATDRISLTGIAATGHHGVFEHERRDGQTFVADVVLHVDTRSAAADDRLDLTVDYGVLAEQVVGVLEGEPADLVETVAERIAAVAMTHRGVLAVDVVVHKPQAPVTVPFSDVSVAIHRDLDHLPVLSAPPVVHAGVTARVGEDDGAVGPDLEAGPDVEPDVEPDLEPEQRPKDDRVLHGTWASGATALGQETRRSRQADRTDAAEHDPAVDAFGGVAGAAGAVGVPGVGATGASALAGTLEGTATFPAPAPGTTETVAFSPDGESAGGQEDDDSQERLDRVPDEPVDAVLALGSNVGSSHETLRQVVRDIDSVDGVEVTSIAPLARTGSVGGPEQPDYLNTVVLVRTTLSPRALLREAQGIEALHGRVREERWGPRTIDIDLITYGSLVASSDDLELPHPRAHERAFVLEPWAQVAPDAVLPGLGGGPVSRLAGTAPDRSGIRWMALDWWAPPEAGPR